MRIAVISPEHEHPHEHTVMGGLFAAGLERYHVRKPAWSREKLETWLRALATEWRPRLVIHQHHALAAALDLGGVHWRDEAASAILNPPPPRPAPLQERRVHDDAPRFTSRSCHTLSTLRAALGHYDSVFFGPVFPSLSKSGHGPRPDLSTAELSSLLAARNAPQRRTSVLALGGITAERIEEVNTLGFDGVAVLGAVWQSADPIAAFRELRESLHAHAA